MHLEPYMYAFAVIRTAIKCQFSLACALSLVRIAKSTAVPRYRTCCYTPSQTMLHVLTQSRPETRISLSHKIASIKRPFSLQWNSRQWGSLTTSH